MRFLPSLFILVLAVAGRLSAQDPIVITGTIPDRSIVQPVRTPAIDLRTYFSVPTITRQVVQFTTAKGTFNVEMNSVAAPNTVANFLAYVNANRFTNSIVHRSVPGIIIQGGGYIPDTSSSLFTSYFTIVKNAALAMEATDGLTHTKGTIAMARVGGSLNSATSEWFINATDNTSQFDPASAGSAQSYAAFGRVTGTGMAAVVDVIAALPVLNGTVTVTSSQTNSISITVDSSLSNYPTNFGNGWDLLGRTVATVSGNFVTLNANANQTITPSSPVPFATSKFGSPFDDLPVQNNLPLDNSVAVANLVTVNSIAAVPVFPATAGGKAVVSFTAASTNPGLVNASILGSNLYVTAAKNLTGAAIVTVTAIDSNGNSAQTSFNVNVTRQVRDFNSDGNPDFVFQNNAGQIAAWYLDTSGALIGSTILYSPGLGDWRIVATADMNGDGIADFLFQNTAGQIAVWYLNASGGITSVATLYAGSLGDWRIAAVADINGDGNNDLLFQNNVGQIAVWYMNGSGSIITIGSFYGAGLGDWRLKCAADMNGDGISDLIFQNTIGQIAVWYLNATGTLTSSGLLYGGGLGDWKVAGTADINRDGTADLLFQNNIGQIAVWYLSPTGTVTGSAILYGAGLGDWRLR